MNGKGGENNDDIIGKSLNDSDYRQYLIGCGMKSIILSLYLSSIGLCLGAGYYAWSHNKKEIKQCLHSMRYHIKNSLRDIEQKFEKK